MQLGLMLCKDHCGIRRRSFELGYHVHVKLSEEMCQSQLCGNCAVFCHRGCLRLSKTDRSNPVHQLSSLTLRLWLLCGMWKKKFFLSLSHETVIS